MPDLGIVSTLGATLTLELSQGASFSQTLRLLDRDAAIIDLTGCVARAQVRRTATAAAVIATFGIAFAADRTTGQLTLSLTDEVTAAMTTGPKLRSAASRYFWDLELETASGDVYRVAGGALYLEPEVTRSAP